MKKLSLSELIDQVADLRDLNWGVRVGPMVRYRAPRFMSYVLKQDESFPVIENTQFIKTPVREQRLGDCVAEATVLRIQWQIQKSFGQTVLIDPERLYWESRQDHYGNTEDEGLQVHEAADTAKKIGLLPADTAIARGEMSVDQILTFLRTGPCMVAHSVHDGWRPSNLHSENGALKESLDLGAKKFQNNHCTLRLNSNIHNGTMMFLDRNSWGPCGQRNDGLIGMTVGHSMKWMIDSPVQLFFGDRWKNFRGWEDWVKE